MKRLVNVVLACSMLVALAACAAPAPAPQTPAPQAPAAQQPAPAAPAVPAAQQATQQVTLRVSNWHLAEKHWEKAIKDAIPIFEKENPDIKVNLEVVSYAEASPTFAWL